MTSKKPAKAILQIAALGLILTAASFASAKGAVPLDADSEKALQQTQQMMNDQTQRAKMLQQDEKARATDATVRSNLGNHTDGAYQISSQVLETIVRETGGDPAKMQALTSELMANPQMLEKYLSPAQREQIRSMASDIEAKKGNAPANSGR